MVTVVSMLGLWALSFSRVVDCEKDTSRSQASRTRILFKPELYTRPDKYEP